MPDNDEPSKPDGQAFAERKYAALKRAVEGAGFFVPQVVGEPDGDRIVCTSKYQIGYGYTGRIAFVTEAAGCWYVATPPHPYHYRILDPCRVEQVVVAFLGQPRNSEEQLVDGSVDLQRELVRISDEEYERAVSGGEGSE